MGMISEKFENSVLILRFCERVDTSNAAEVEEEVQAICAKYDTEQIIVDAEKTKYISSAGLRVLLRLRKNKPQVKIINTNAEVYDILDMTGFTEMIPVEKAYRQMSVEGCRIIGRGAKGTVYRYDADTVVKVYNDSDCLPDIQKERELARKAFVLGIPTAISYDVVRVGDKFGSVFELLDAKSYSQLILEEPEKLEARVQEYAELLRTIHGTAVKETDMPDGRPRVDRWVSFAREFLSPEDGQKLSRMATAIPDRMTMLHGDYHTNNIMSQNGETLLIDMDTLCYGHPIFELANVFVSYVAFAQIDPKIMEDFFGFDVETGKKIWQAFLPAYLGTENEKKIAETEKKIAILGYARVLRHLCRRTEASEQALKAKKICIEKMHQYINEIDSFDF